MLCIGQRHELDMSRNFWEMDESGALDLGHGVWMYTRNTNENDLGKESERAEYCFCALDCHRIGRGTKDGVSSLMALGIAVNLQEKIGGYIYWCDEEEGYTFYLGGVKAFEDRTYDWWVWPYPDDWWVAYLDGYKVVDWQALADECTRRERDWYLSMVTRRERDNA